MNELILDFRKGSRTGDSALAYLILGSKQLNVIRLDSFQLQSPDYAPHAYKASWLAKRLETAFQMLSHVTRDWVLRDGQALLLKTLLPAPRHGKLTEEWGLLLYEPANRFDGRWWTTNSGTNHPVSLAMAFNALLKEQVTNLPPLLKPDEPWMPYFFLQPPPLATINVGTVKQYVERARINRVLEVLVFGRIAGQVWQYEDGWFHDRLPNTDTPFAGMNAAAEDLLSRIVPWWGLETDLENAI